MSNELLIALVAAGAGLGGALVGGASSLAASYFAPKWEREHEARVRRNEQIRLAIIRWISCGQVLSASVTKKKSDISDRSRDYNLAVSELTSLLAKNETVVENFIHGASAYAGRFRLNEAARTLIVSHAGRLLLEWQRDDRDDKNLRPFKLVHSDWGVGATLRYTSNWRETVEGEVMDTVG